jgi:Uma2 family endonuclease
LPADGVIDGERTVTPASQVAVGAWTAADLLEHFGPIPLHRIRHDPAPGTATEDDVVEIHLREDRLYELVDGVLVEKTVGTYESYLAVSLIEVLAGFVRKRRLGIVLGPDGMMRLSPGLIRIPDVSYVSFDRLPGRAVPETPVADLAPDLAIEVISKGNTKKEMDRKLSEYFQAGVREVWFVYHQPRREVVVYHSPDRSAVFSEDASVHGGDVLPGFVLELKQLFAQPGTAE